MSFTESDFTLENAKELDQKDPLSSFRSEFDFSEASLYFAGHSLGLRPKKSVEYINEELEKWKHYAVEGHFVPKEPWVPYHELLASDISHLLGAKESEVVAMNTLTVNLHLMLVSFFRPEGKRRKIVIEGNCFPSDVYAVKSQLRFHGLNPEEDLLILPFSEDGWTHDEKECFDFLEDNKDEIALVLLGNCNYLSGQAFSIKRYSEKTHEIGALFGLNLAHGAGNLVLDLSKDNVDFAVCCSYKYLNSGPGNISFVFVNEKHHHDPSIPRFEGWWGTDKKNRFLMKDVFEPIPTAEAWQLSNAPTILLASLRGSLELYTKAGIQNLRTRGDKLTSYLELGLTHKCQGKIKVVTPKFCEEEQTRGSMLSVLYSGDGKKLYKKLVEKQIIADFREPNILRFTPVPIYNNYEDVFHLVDELGKTVE
ncbi:MAG: kynureninase [Bacteriovoracaceae bacterium]